MHDRGRVVTGVTSVAINQGCTCAASADTAAAAAAVPRAAEKAAKQARKERLLQKQSSGPNLFGSGNLLTAQLQQQLLGLVSCVCASDGLPSGLSRHQHPMP